jgi:polyhydroxybutyrate depolymerase
MNLQTSRAGGFVCLWLTLVGGCVAPDTGVDYSVPGPGSAGTSGATSNGASAGSPTTPGASGSTAEAGSASGGSQTGGSSNGGVGGSTATAGMSGGGNGGLASGGSGGGTNNAQPSVGCGLPASQALGSWVEQPMTQINGKSRQWWIWLPTGYEPTRAYPVVFTFHGCGGPDNIIPMQKVTGADAIVVRGTGITDSCWTYGANGDDVKFFDFMLADLEAKRCIDRSRVFTSGYSSGAWLVNTLNCQRGDKLRGSGSVSGGVAVDTSKCPGSASPTPGVKPKEFARIFIHDADDTTNKFVGNGNDKELARLLAANHCMPKGPVSEDPAPCARYQGCDAGMPVVMCETTGKKHDRQDALATTAFWKFFSSL